MIEQLVTYYTSPDSAGYRTDIVIARINGSDEHDIVHNFRVMRFPTLTMFFPNSKLI